MYTRDVPDLPLGDAPDRISANCRKRSIHFIINNVGIIINELTNHQGKILSYLFT